MYDLVGHFLSAPTHLDDWDDFGSDIAGRPDPHILCRVLHIRPEFVQLDMDQIQFEHEAFVQLLALHPAAAQPGANRDLAYAEHLFQGRGFIRGG